MLTVPPFGRCQVSQKAVTLNLLFGARGAGVRFGRYWMGNGLVSDNAVKAASFRHRRDGRT